MRFTAAAVVLGFALLLPTQAFAARDFSLRFGTNQPGAVTTAANTLMTCPAAEGACLATRAGQTTGAVANDNSYAMTYVDVDGDPTTFDSSAARLSLPAGAEVLFAGLYYGADTSAGTRGRAALNAQATRTVRLRAPGDLSYRTLSADQLDTIGTRYQGFVDVTPIVHAAGGGDYTVANVQAGTGEDRYGGWALVVAYADPAQPPRNISIFDGFQTVSSAQPNLNVPVSGFLAPQTGTVRTNLAFVAYEGDRGSTGDAIRLNDTTLSSPTSPADNFFNSAIERDGAPVTTKDPDYDNQLGFDVGQLAADGIIPNGATSAVIRLTTRAALGETYFPGVVAFATDLYAPRIQPQKSVADVNGGDVVPGDVLDYTIRVPNDGQDGAQNVVLRDQIPDRTTYVPGSAEVVGGPGTADFDAATNSLAFRVGTGATATSGGALAPGDASVVRFRVTVDPTVPAQTVIVNQARAEFFSQTLGLPMATESDPVATPVQTPDLTIDKSHTGNFSAGQSATFHIAVTNNGGATTSGPITVTDAFVPANFTVTGASGGGFTCTAGPTVTCTRAAPLAPGASATIDIGVDVAAGAPESLANTAAVAGGGDGDTSNNTDTDEVGVVAQANLAVTKTVSPTRIPVGETATYELVVRNNGPANATGVTLVDPLPSGVALISAQSSRGSCAGNVTCSIGALGVGASAIVDVTVRGLTSGVGTVDNTASVNAAQVDPVLADDTASAALDVVGAADLSITKSAAPEPIDVGAGPTPVTYTLTVHNAGPQTATAIAVDDPVAAELTDVTAATDAPGTCAVAGNAVHCDIPTLASGASATIAIAATVPESMAAATLLNGATVTGSPDDPDLQNNTATTSNLVLPAADIELNLVGPVDPVAPGGTATFTLNVDNLGPSQANAITATDTLPEGVVFVSSPDGCTAVGRIVTCPIGNLSSGQHTQATIIVRAEIAAAGQTLTNIVDIASTAPDPVTPSNRDVWTFQVAGATPVSSAPFTPTAPSTTTPAAGGGGGGSSPAPDCLANLLRLVDVTPGARTVSLAGETARANAGRTVTLLFAGKRVGTATVAADGTFRKQLPLPPRSIRATNKARYQATLGTLRSPALKLMRRMYMTRISSSGGRVTISGLVTKPLAKPVQTVTLREFTDCRGKSFRVVKRGIKVSSSGRFKVTIPAPAGVDVAYYRALTRVRKTTRNRRTFPTFTTLRGIAVKRG